MGLLHHLHGVHKHPRNPADGQSARWSPIRIIYLAIESNYRPAANRICKWLQGAPGVGPRELPLWRGPLDVLLGTNWHMMALRDVRRNMVDIGSELVLRGLGS